MRRRVQCLPIIYTPVMVSINGLLYPVTWVFDINVKFILPIPKYHSNIPIGWLIFIFAPIWDKIVINSPN